MIILYLAIMAFLVYGVFIKWNFRQRLFCPLAKKFAWDKLWKKADCKRYELPPTVTVDVCGLSGLLPSPFCKIKIARIYARGLGPTATCAVCKASEPEEVFPLDNPKPSWMPDMVCAELGLHYNLRLYPAVDLKKFAEKLSLAGVDHIRIMGDWESTFEPGPGTSAFERAPSGKFDLNRPNGLWDVELAFLKRLLEPYHIKIYFDLIDRCDADKGPWEYNEQGFKSIYDPMLLQRYIDFFDRVYAILGRDAKWGIGNEFLGDKTDWMRECVLPLAEHMYDRVDKPICFSGDDMTGHHLHGLLSPDVSTKFGIRDGCLVRHGAATPLQIRTFLESGSGSRCYAYSDDGVTMENLSPEHGPCVPASVFCQGTIEQRIAVVKMAWEIQGKNLDHIEFLPRELSWGENPNTISQDSLGVYPALAQALWGIDIKRRMP